MGYVPILLLMVLSGAAVAQDDAVVVTALRNPVTKPYKKMIEGLDHFQQRRHLAPQATLRFKVLPRKPDAKLEGIELEVASESVAVPLPVEKNGTFALKRDGTALEENARVEPNRKAGTITWRADVRTPGLPENARRLGDLRLECEVGMKSGLVSEYPPSFFGWLDELFPQGPAYCHREAPRYLFFADRPLWSVTLAHGERRKVLPVDRLYAGATANAEWKKKLPYCDCEALVDRAYFVPLGDAGWPDDTLVLLEYM
jgi:hypothetical protein